MDLFKEVRAKVLVAVEKVLNLKESEEVTMTDRNALADQIEVRAKEAQPYNGSGRMVLIHQHEVSDVLAALRQPSDSASTRAREEIDGLLQRIGDGIANMFEQMLRGKWTDDHAHDVRNNKAMVDLKDTLNALMKYRAEHLGYEDVLALSSPGGQEEGGK